MLAEGTLYAGDRHLLNPFAISVLRQGCGRPAWKQSGEGMVWANRMTNASRHTGDCFSRMPVDARS
ncbi:hypothetical protein FRUB_07758 [Fimbriiglobus ruber]|uniref:Uncharacterized protein n=1 Tax=Fimbriiglobus ruber TaxID=1908690 RepID=A0A225DJ73_9BACT|nr:hypothetical protein FRUB_07758 [Fimbriiglobus ruber]